MLITDEKIIEACQRSCELDWSITSVDLLREMTQRPTCDCRAAIELAAMRDLVDFGSSPHYAWAK